jgi:hypothetical protein
MDKTEQKHVVTERDQNIHIVSSGTVKMDPAKIQAIANRLEPKTVKQIQQFLGLCTYYRRFIYKAYPSVETANI